MVPFVGAFVLLAGLVSTFSQDGELEATKTGPWGKIEYFETILEPTIPGFVYQRIQQLETIWKFGQTDQSGVSDLLQEIGIPSDLIDELCTEGRWFRDSTGLAVVVPDSLISELTMDQRTALYPRVYNQEALTHLSFNIQRGNLDYLTSDLPRADVERIRSFLFRREKALSLIDVGPLLRSYPDFKDVQRVYNSLVRVQGLVAQLRVCPEEDLSSIINYWSANGKNPNVADFLEEVTGSSRTAIDLFHLLPPVPKRYLNTYPKISASNYQDAIDCWWTAINFFNPDPSPRLLDPLPLSYFLERGFERVQPPYQFGDLILLYGTDGQDKQFLVHAYNHVADEIVFSKNGKGNVQPWILIRESDVLSLYAYTETKKLVFRRKPSASKLLPSSL
tara:strand:- start:4667 stop:5839 length:1173 start_codon:yes stop_codon:yes gene_type:complete